MADDFIKEEEGRIKYHEEQNKKKGHEEKTKENLVVSFEKQRGKM
ncbi:hypothetical protein BVRB_9g219310 [Beta vulgaris subsp. vulgaris]|nr:hypothetical protein BVRB_9g219310 [Beta vulgaris subsp. vulgaris]